MMIQQRRVLTIMQTVEEAGVSRRTVYNWIKSGKVEVVRTPSGLIRIFEDSIWRNNDMTPRKHLNDEGTE